VKQGGRALLPPMSASSASVAFTGRAEGDMGHGGAPVVEVDGQVAARRRAVVDLPWTWLRQVHGADVVPVLSPGDGAGATADAAVTDVAGAALAVLTADCAPVAFVSAEGVIGVAHAGWRGVTAGVLERTVATMRSLGATRVGAILGPCIRAECYEFGEEDLAAVADRLGDGVRATSAEGRPSLDLPAAVREALARAGVAVDVDLTDVGICTACSPDHYSWRAGRDTARQAAVVWR
jgi:YfiH family protein